MSLDEEQDRAPEATERAAPGRLDLVRSLLNTLDREAGTDLLADRVAASRWLAQAGCPDRLDADEHRRLLALRETLRERIVRRDEDGEDEADGPALDGTLTAVLAPDGVMRLEPVGAGVERLVGTLLVAIAEAQAGRTWTRLKVCAAPECRWAFYDASRNRAGTWCSMAECGNRAKARRFRARSEQIRGRRS